MCVCVQVVVRERKLDNTCSSTCLITAVHGPLHHQANLCAREEPLAQQDTGLAAS